MNALLGYGSSSSGESEDEAPEKKSAEEGESAKPKLPKPTLGETQTSVFSNPFVAAESAKPKLPTPTLGENALQTSVFSNPFVAAEQAKAAILEKHVKMVPGKRDMTMINGKKICWNYRKGRCRFGHNCKYAHDSDIQKSNEELDAEKQKLNTVVCESSGTITSAPPPPVTLEPMLPTDDELWEGGPEKKKRRPGLTKGLVPGKKVLQMYKQQKKGKKC